MPTTVPTNESEIAALREELRKQQKQIASIERRLGPQASGLHWKGILALAALVLLSGGYAAYRYYLVLKSITDQFPQ